MTTAEVMRRTFGFPQDFTRKLIHIGAGMWVFGILALFDTWYIGVVPFATFIVLNFYRCRVFKLWTPHIAHSVPSILRYR